LFSAAAVIGAEDPNAAADPTKAAATDDPNGVAVTVDGFAITEGDLASEMKPVLDRMAARSSNNPQFLQQYAERLRQQVLDGLIVEHLLGKEVKAAGIAVTEEQVTEKIEEMARRQSMSMEDFKSLVESFGKSLDEVRQRIARGLAYEKLMETRFKEKIAVTEEEARQYYDQNTGEFHKGEQVEASHILIKPETAAPADPNLPAADPNQAKAAARSRAAEILGKIRQGEDFAELAKAHSNCPSASKGGQLGFGTRSDPNTGTRGTWVEPFEKAAFALDVGQVSDVVETRFGYHIIKATGRTPAATRPFEQVRDDIIQQLSVEKQRQVGGEYIESLKAGAEIVYPPSPSPGKVPSGN
jgi:peptidyl-prolyl cis-trans isomerase C